MELASTQEEQPANINAPIPSQHIRNIDDVPAIYTELAVQCYRRSKENRENPSLTLVDECDAAIVGLMSHAMAPKINNNMWNVRQYACFTDRLRTHRTEHLKCLPQDHDCDIEHAGKTHEKIVATVKSGWSQIPPHTIASNVHLDYDWYCFIKTLSLYHEHRLLNKLLKKFNALDLAISFFLEQGHTTAGNPEHHQVLLLIRREAFEEVQAKLCLHLPSPEEFR